MKQTLKFLHQKDRAVSFLRGREKPFLVQYYFLSTYKQYWVSDWEKIPSSQCWRHHAHTSLSNEETLLVCLRGHVLVYMLVCMYVKVRGQPHVLLLRWCSPFFETRSLFGLELANQTRLAGQCALGMSVSPVLGSTMLGFNISLGESNSSPLASILLTISTSYPCNPVRKHFLVNISMSQLQPEHRIRWRTVISWTLWPQIYRVFTWIDICIDRTCISMTDIQEKDPWLCDEKTSECNLARFGVTRISHVTKV